MEYIKIFGATVEIEEINNDSMYNRIMYKIKNLGNVGYDGIEFVAGVSDLLFAEYEDDSEEVIFSLGHYNQETYGPVFVKVIAWHGYMDDIKVKDIS